MVTQYIVYLMSLFRFPEHRVYLPWASIKVESCCVSILSYNIVTKKFSGGLKKV